MEEKTVKMNVPTFNELIEDLGDEYFALDEEQKQRLKNAYDWEISFMMKYVLESAQPTMTMSLFRKAGKQNIAEFAVNDLGIPRGNSYNFHGQNTSQWRYAGAILVQNGEVSTHH